ncbi:MAG TPA: polysaccharide deacetylase family protein, partial [Planctomycetota bacterium]|nr:polysaccharide deacetylase family protein [Planctomycetota bacterium]
MTRKPFAWPAARRAAVSLTFDDARLTQPDPGIPILDRFDVRATFYVTPRNVTDRVDAWASAVRNGHEIGNHTVTHPCSGNYPWSRNNALEDYTLDRIEKEMLDASAWIETTLGVVPRTFAYPCAQTFVGRGERQQSYVPLVAKHFLAGRHAFNDVPADPAFCDLAQVNSVELDRRSWEDTRRLIEQASADGAWLVFFGHEE